MLRAFEVVGKSPRTHIQTELFPFSNPHSILLVSLPLDSGKDFLQIVERVAPRLIVDFRDVPRFDFDALSRSRVFEVFAKLNSVYVDSDLTAEPQLGEAQWSRTFSQQHLLSETQKGSVYGPYMFLFNSGDSFSAFEAFLQKELPSASWSIFCITRENDFAMHRFAR